MAHRPRVLIADDDALAAQTIERAIRSWGYEVVAVVGSGKQAMEAARRQPVDVAILDVAMPHGDGLTVARDLDRTHDIRVILLSGYPSMPLLAQALDVKVPCLRKPVRLPELEAALRSALRPARPTPARVVTDTVREEDGM